jgi:hypothetical protein
MDFLIECMDDLSMEQQKVCVLFSPTFYCQLTLKKKKKIYCYGFLFDYHDTCCLFQFQFYYRSLSRQQAQQAAWLQKRRYHTFLGWLLVVPVYTPSVLGGALRFFIKLFLLIYIYIYIKRKDNTYSTMLFHVSWFWGSLDREFFLCVVSD